MRLLRRYLPREIEGLNVDVIEGEVVMAQVRRSQGFQTYFLVGEVCRGRWSMEMNLHNSVGLASFARLYIFQK